jgi:hypothetical protein
MLELFGKRAAMTAHCNVEHRTTTPPEWLIRVISGREIQCRFFA